MKLLALVLLLSAFSSLTLTEVVNSFKQSCPSFFIRNPEKQNDFIVPTLFSGRQYKTICQRWKNRYTFATMYDTEKRIPVYSAYTFLKKENTIRSDEWKIEPQLENIEEYKNKKEMMDSPRDEVTVRKITHQAVNSDYTGSGFTRGHVFPRSFAADQDQADSTFTLTNIAPQTEKSNGEWEQKVEDKMPTLIKDNCKLEGNHQAYIVTGAVPGKKWIKITRDKRYNEGINVPSHFWSAFCCYSKKDINKLVGKAYLGDLENVDVREPTIGNLNKRLTELYGQKFEVFPGLPVEDIKPKMNLQFIPSFIQSFITFLYNFASELKFSI